MKAVQNGDLRSFFTRYSLLLSMTLLILIGIAFVLVILTDAADDVSAAGQDNSGEYVGEEYAGKITVAEALTARGIEIFAGDLVEPSLDTVVVPSRLISVTRAHDIIINDGGVRHELRMIGGGTEEWLAAAGISLNADDIIYVPAASGSTLTVNITRVFAETVTVETPISYKTVEKQDNTLEVGIKRTVSEGTDGVLQKTVKHIYENGVYKYSEELSQTVLKQPIDKVIARGTINIAEKEGVLFEFTEVLTVKSYAYTEPGGLTRMETPCRVGAIAVDPKVIPLGTKLYVEGYGFATAEDTGSMIKGNTIDVYFDSEDECYTWGIKYPKVYILK